MSEHATRTHDCQEQKRPAPSLHADITLKHMRRTMRWGYRLLFLLVLAAFLMQVYPHIVSVSVPASYSSDLPPSTQVMPSSTLPKNVSPGMGAGAVGTHQQHSAVSLAAGQGTASCNWFDPLCWAQQAVNTIAQSMATALTSFLIPIVTGLDQNSSNILTTTPICISNLNGCQIGQTGSLDQTLLTFMQWGIGTVDAAALTFVLVFIGLSLMWGRQIGIPVYGFSEAIPRVMLLFLVASVSPMIVQSFIDLNNALCQSVLQVGFYSVLTNIIIGLVGTGLSAGWLVWLLITTLLVMNILLDCQMVLRLAFLVFLAALAPLGLLCFAVHPTVPLGKLWLSNFVTTVFVQFLQVSMLVIGAMIFSNVIALMSPLLAHVPDGQILMQVTLLIAILYLTLRLPGTLRHWALAHVADQAGQAALSAVGETAQAAALALAA